MAKNQGFFVKVVKVPRGPAPEVVKRAWVGLTLAASGYNPGAERDFLTGAMTPSRKSIMVPIAPALEVLGKKNPSAAEWFRVHLPGYSRTFTFGADELEVLKLS